MKKKKALESPDFIWHLKFRKSFRAIISENQHFASRFLNSSFLKYPYVKLNQYALAGQDRKTYINK